MSIPKKTQPQKADIRERVDLYLKDNKKLLDNHGLDMNLIINFSPKQKVPFLWKLAIKRISKSGGQLDIRFTDKK